MRKTKIKSNSIITQKEFESGIWQFCIDHGVPMGENVYHVKFGVTTQDDLMRRIYSRASGMYRIKDEDEIEKELHKMIEQYAALKRVHKDADIREKKICKLPKWKQSVILRLRKTTNKLIGKWISEIVL